jgi:hypothetical protein
MSKEQYSKMLQLRNKIFTGGLPEPPEDGTTSPIMELEPLHEYPFEPFFNELSTILESKIFRDGQFNVNRYKYFQIVDFEEFIWLVCRKIHNFSPVDEDQRISYELSNLMEAIEECGDTIRRLFGKRAESQLTALKEKVETWLKNVQKSSPQFIITDRQLSDDITEIFKKHIPNVPEDPLIGGVCKVLELFDIKCKPKTVIQRKYRKRKALSEK